MITKQICSLKRLMWKIKENISNCRVKDFKQLLKRKEYFFSRHLASSSWETWEEYKKVKNEVKAAKRTADEKWSRKIV